MNRTVFVVQHKNRPWMFLSPRHNYFARKYVDFDRAAVFTTKSGATLASKHIGNGVVVPVSLTLTEIPHSRFIAYGVPLTE